MVANDKAMWSVLTMMIDALRLFVRSNTFEMITASPITSLPLADKWPFQKDVIQSRVPKQQLRA